MSFPAEMIALPFQTDEAGTIKIKGTRIPIDNIIEGYNRGQTPEQIVENFDVLKLSDVYATLAYYLNNKNDVDMYLDERRAYEEHVRQTIISQPNMIELRERYQKLKATKTSENNL